MERIALGQILVALLVGTARAEATPPPHSPAPNVASRPTNSRASGHPRIGDVDTVEHIMWAMYDVISGPVGGRDWDRLRSLFYPDARLFIVGRSRPDGSVETLTNTVDEYIERHREYFRKEALFEESIANYVEHFHRVAHVWSVYEARHSPDEAQPFERGINSVQLFYDGARWWILTIYWQRETPKHMIPDRYLRKGSVSDR